MSDDSRDCSGQIRSLTHTRASRIWGMLCWDLKYHNTYVLLSSQNTLPHHNYINTANPNTPFPQLSSECWPNQSPCAHFSNSLPSQEMWVHGEWCWIFHGVYVSHALWKNHEKAILQAIFLKSQTDSSIVHYPSVTQSTPSEEGGTWHVNDLNNWNR